MTTAPSPDRSSLTGSSRAGAARKLTPAALLTVLKEALKAFNQDKAPRLAAALAYYAILSLAPLLVLAVALLGNFLKDPATMNSLFGPEGVVTQNLGSQAAEALQDMLPKGDALNKGTLIASLIGFVTLFLSATGLFVQLQDALNSLWGADPAPKQGPLQMIRTRLISFLMILFIGAILVVFLGVNTYLSAIAHDLGARLGLGALLVRLVTVLVSTLFLTPVFAFIFKFLPTIKLQWKETWVGAAVTALLFTVGQLLIGLYFGRAAPGSAFGAAAAPIALLVWLYYSAMIFFFGAEVTWVYSQKYGSRAGGAANTAKKQALVAQGARLPTTPSAQEQQAAAQANRPIRDARGRVLGLPAPYLPFAQKSAPPRPRQSPALPSLGSAVWNIVSAIMAVPALIFLKLTRLGNKKN